MRRSAIFALSTASTAVIAFTGLAGTAQAQQSVTPGEVNECSSLPTEQERLLCVQGQADDEAAPSEQGDIATLPPAEQAEQRAEGDTIVVTGSRIRRTEFTSPDPIQIINPDLAIQEGKNETVEIINSSPIASGSSQITSAISTNFVTNGGEGAQTVSLRGLGAERTLTLMNGRRAGPAGVRGAVASFDLNVIPSSVIDSVEILKTGASSIYGSDAIAGVVNILTKKETNGLEIRGFVSAPFESGGEAYNVNATYGKDFGRGHFIVTADYFKREDLERRDRSFTDCEEEYLTFTDGRRADLRDVDGSFSCSGTLQNSALTNNDYQSIFGLPRLLAPNGQQLFVSRYGGPELNGVCVPLNSIPTITAPDNFYGCNFDGPSTGALDEYTELQRGTDIVSDLSRYSLFGAGAFELTPNIELFTELLYNKRKTYTDGVSQVSSFQFTGNSLLPSLTRNPATGGLSLNPAYPGVFCTDADFNCVVGDPGDPFNTEFGGNFLLRPLIEWDSDSGTEIDYYRGVLGARGDFGGFARNFSWDLHGQYSLSDGEYFQDYARADSVFTQDFRTRSCVGLTTPVTGLPCIDIDFMDPRVLAGNFTQEERDFLFDRDVGHTRFTQLSGEGFVSGSLFQLPAGEIGVAGGVHIRRDKIKDTPGEASQLDNRYNLTSSGITAGDTVTREVFGELEIPVIHNTPLIQRLTLSAAGRVTRVKAERRDGVGDKFGDETYKVGFDWEVNDWLRFRGSQGTSFRAPALFELFLESQTGFQSQQNIDICINTAQRLAQGTITQTIFDNCAAAGIPSDFQGATGGATVVQGGGIGNLAPETSKAKTASIILTPTFGFLPDTRVSLAVDYFDIEVDDEISRLGAGNIIIGCYNSQNFSSEPLCDLITRLPAGAVNEYNVVEVRDTYINVNSQRNRGIDVTTRIDHNFGNLGRLSFLGQMTWQLEDVVALFEGTEVELNGEAGEPKWVGDFNLNWRKGPWTVLYGLDVTGKTSDFDDLIDDQGAPCRTSLFRPGVPPEEAAQGGRVQFCPDVRQAMRAYHSLSVTRNIGDKFAMTVGMSNIFDTAPPRVSTVFNGGISTLGQVSVFSSQYDYLGRRMFVNVRGNF